MSAMKGGYNSVVRQAQKLQSRLSKLQEEMADRTVEAQVGGGAIKLTINGDRKVVELSIDPGVVDAEDVESLQDLLIAAFNEAISNVQEMIDSETSKLTGGINMPWIL